jgi:hypothetical protein
VLFAYDKNLIERVIKYISKKTGEDISAEQAEEYLNSLADLYESFIEFTKAP